MICFECKYVAKDNPGAIFTYVCNNPDSIFYQSDVNPDDTCKKGEE